MAARADAVVPTRLIRSSKLFACIAASKLTILVVAVAFMLVVEQNCVYVGPVLAVAENVMRPRRQSIKKNCQANSNRANARAFSAV